ncbi:MAG TPA: phenylacetate--CoA ligase family protein [Thermodesulfobacteriaceae bacterium]|nr:phenylacetate--CoA ligase family protein [Thermodesulfobacteriaceae bacterium]
MENAKIEYLSPEAWRQWHTELLQSTVNRVYKRVPFYRKAMDAAGVHPEDIRSLEDMRKLPFITREDLSTNYPYDLFAVPLRDIVRIHTLRSAQKNPVALGYTKQDLEHRRNLTARFLQVCGVSPDDVVQICLDPGLAMLGQELKEGAETLGALVISPDPLNSSARLRVLVDFKTTAVITSPSYGRHLLWALQESGKSLASISLKKGIFVAETLDHGFRKELKKNFALDACSGYGIFEAMGPGMAYECPELSGLHLAMDHFIPEIVDPASGNVLPHGETGELVITTVTTRSNPLIRFRTGDLTRLDARPCPCGRTTWRMAPVEGPCNDLVSVRGIRIAPEQIDTFIEAQTEDDPPDHLLVIKNHNYLEKIELWIAINHDLFTGSLPQLHNWCRELENSFEETIGLSCQVRPVELRTIKPYLDEGRTIVTMNSQPDRMQPV